MMFRQNKTFQGKGSMQGKGREKASMSVKDFQNRFCISLVKKAKEERLEWKEVYC